jgi:DNA gyrase subunit B
MEGGTHEEGLRNALIREIKNYLKIIKRENEEKDLTIDDIREGLTGIISVKHSDPQYEGQTKTRLANIEIRKVVLELVSKYFSQYLLEKPEIAQIIITKILLAKQARLAADKVRKITRKEPSQRFSTLPGKLADCASKDVTKREL